MSTSTYMHEYKRKNKQITACLLEQMQLHCSIRLFLNISSLRHDFAATVAIMLQYTGMVEIYKTLVPFNVIMDEDPQDCNSATSKKAWVQGVTCVKEADFKRFVIANAIANWKAARDQGQSTPTIRKHPYTSLSLAGRAHQSTCLGDTDTYSKCQ